MKRFVVIGAFLVVLVVAAPGAPAAAPEGVKPQAPETAIELKVPLFSPLFTDVPVATVDDERITLDELNEALATVHERGPEKEGEAAEGEEARPAPKADYTAVLDRLINVRLINMEAAEVGIDDLPEVKAALKEYEGSAMREILKSRQVKGVRPDEKQADKIYRDAVREWKIRSLIFDKEEDARKMADELGKGKGFEDAAKPFLAEKKARGGEEGQYTRAEKLLPQIAEAVAGLDKGAVGPVVRVASGYVALRVDDIRYPDDPKARAQAEQASLEQMQLKALKKYYDALLKKYVKVNKALLKGLDFEAKEPGFGRLLKDGRSLVEIKGEKPITVGELAGAIDEKFYHGIERAIEEKKVNDEKTPVLDEMMYRRLFDKEALRLGLRKTPEYRKLVDSYKTSLIFSTFIQKVVVPDVKVKEDEVKKYYGEHIADFTYPEMVKLYGVPFLKQDDAQAAVAKLKEGVDFKWLRANSEGRARDDAPGLMTFDGETFAVKGMPEELKNALYGAKTGDYRLYPGAQGIYYALYVKELTPSKEQPYKDAREGIAKKLFNENLNKSVQDWADKLRKAHKVRVYITGLAKKPE